MAALEDRIEKLKNLMAHWLYVSPSDLRHLRFVISEMIDYSAVAPTWANTEDTVDMIRYFIAELGFNSAELRRLRFEIGEMIHTESIASSNQVKGRLIEQLGAHVKKAVDKRANDLQDILEKI